MRQSLFLIDIEGEEFKMLNEENISMLKESILVIENHSFLSKKEDVKRFFELIKKYYNLEILNNGSRNPYNIKEIDDFDDDENKLLISKKINYLEPVLTVSTIKKLNKYFRKSLVIELYWEKAINFSIDKNYNGKFVEA